MGAGALASGIRKNLIDEDKHEYKSLSQTTVQAFVDQEFLPHLVSIATEEQTILAEELKKEIVWLRPGNWGSGEFFHGTEGE